jgi:single-stranded-DNA-specific exonuclease
VYPLLTNSQFQAAIAAGVGSLHAQLLSNRAVKIPSTMKAFLDAKYEDTYDPLTLIDMSRASARIQQALEHKEHITVYGDYDADGITSSALLFRALRTLKQPEAPLDYHIPHRLRDGCGLNRLALDLLKGRGTQLIITTDCASSDVEQVAYARELGMEVIITDHHPPPTQIPRAYAMVNSWRPECTYGETYLSGVGIAFKLVQALYRAYHRSREEEMEMLDLVAIGTIADIVPLLGENHILVRLGMQRLNATCNPGLKALIASAGLQLGRIRERDIAFGIAPRINAAGRMKEASIAFELLIADSEEEAAGHVAELEQLNLTRQQETEKLMQNVREQAHNQFTKPIVLVSGDNWHEGLIGLVAGKLAEEISKPVLVLSNNQTTRLSRGSARCQKDFNLINALRNCSHYLERYGGHAQAAGFTMHSKHIDTLHKQLIDWKENGGVSLAIGGTELPEQTGVVFEREQGESTQPTNQKMVDLIFTRVALINYNLYKQIRMLAPFGAGNPEPVFKIERLRLLGKQLSGTNQQHLRLRLGATGSKIQYSGTLISGAVHGPSLAGVEYVTIIFKLEASENRTGRVWLKILDIEPA